MNSQIWKFPIKTSSTQTMMMPEGAEILSIETQLGQPCIWAFVNPKSDKTIRTFETYETREHIPNAQRKFIGTYHTQDEA